LKELGKENVWVVAAFYGVGVSVLYSEVLQ